MTAGEDARLTVQELDREGRGMGVAPPTASRFPKMMHVHVSGALPGEEITATIDAASSHRPVAWGTVRAIHKVSPDRVSPICPAFGRCGGCVMQHLNYVAQLAWKQATLVADIRADPLLAGTPVEPAVASPRTLGYRNNAKLVVARDTSGDLVLGAYAPRSHDVIDLLGCAVVEPVLSEVAAALHAVLRAHAVQPYDERSLVGLLRYVVLRSNARGEVLVTMVTASDGFAAGPAVVKALRDACPRVIGVVHNINSTRGNVLFGAEERSLVGADCIVDQIGDIRLRVSSRAFFQANRDVARAAYEILARAVAPTAPETIVDVYSGVGGIALTLARLASSVVGIEEHPAAVADATASAALNGITNAVFIAGDAADALASLCRDRGHADVVILNPPRRGCAAAVLERAVALRPRAIAYLSCAPQTLLADLRALLGHGYRPIGVTPLDMLPHTPHLEALAILTKPS